MTVHMELPACQAGCKQLAAVCTCACVLKSGDPLLLDDDSSIMVIGMTQSNLVLPLPNAWLSFFTSLRSSVRNDDARDSRAQD